MRPAGLQKGRLAGPATFGLAEGQVKRGCQPILGKKQKPIEAKMAASQKLLEHKYIFQNCTFVAKEC